ncbi:hypothetical protein [Flavobacterium frigidarium]|uniref:hypothetical protein n=1 Tax=Flavobacterium frigidarium TaxID=99286 RepID=UPI00041A4BDE|nr:hypothetical protein [Flavobacterium frigidarium]
MQNQGKSWTANDVQTLIALIKGNTPTGLIAFKLGRTEDAIRAKVSSLGLSLAPTNKSPYDRNFSNKKKGK